MPETPTAHTPADASARASAGPSADASAQTSAGPSPDSPADSSADSSIESSAGVSADRPLTDAVASFCRFVRSEGFDVGMSETVDAVRSAELLTLTNEPLFKQALRALLCTTHAEWRRFDDLFEQFWLRSSSAPGRRRDVRPKGRITQAQPRPRSPLLGIGRPGEETSGEDGTSSVGASALERLRKTDFSEVSPQDHEQLERLVLRLANRMRLRLARRQQAKPQRGRLDLRRTIRRSIAYGGDPVDLRYQGPKPRKPRLVALLDVSGSMDQYSFFLLRFIYALQRHFDRVEVFLFSTRLTRVTGALKARRFPDTLHQLADTADAWSSGTRMGACLETFNDEYARRVLTRDTLVFILSDGLDTGDPALLTRELHAIKHRARKLIWLNPLLGMKGYEPLARGIASALPLVDAFVGAHNLESLLDLESHLRHV